MPKPFICKKCGFDLDSSPQHDCIEYKEENPFKYSCVVIDSITSKVVRKVEAADRTDALKLEIWFNVGDTPERFIAEAQFNGVKI